MYDKMNIKLLIIDRFNNPHIILNSTYYTYYTLFLDSIAGLARTEYDTRDARQVIERTKTLFSIASALKWISDMFSISILVVNQVLHMFEVLYD